MTNELNIPKEGDLHSVVSIGGYTFELRYGYYEECDRQSGEPFVLYPDLKTNPLFTEEGNRIVSAIQSICEHYAIPEGRGKEDCCYTCAYYSNRTDDIGICRCERMRQNEQYQATDFHPLM